MNHQFSNGHHGGLIFQEDDALDYEYTPINTKASAPPVYELPFDPTTDQVPRIDQMQQGSCVGHGTSGVMMFNLIIVRGQPTAVLSRAYAYYNARLLEGTTATDSGAQIRDGAKGVGKYGICTEEEMPYNDQVWNVAPTLTDYAAGKLDLAVTYKAVHQPNINLTIADGRPIVYGMNCFSSMMSDEVAKTGVIPMPKDGDEPEGGHCTWLFGYNTTSQPWTSPSGLVYPPHTKAGRNSWREPGPDGQDSDGKWWGAEGNYFLPQAMFDEKQCSDYWVIETTGAAAVA
jgi:hypothetical protein